MTADELINAYVLRQYQPVHPEQWGWAEKDHLLHCPEATADASAEDGDYGCETGCSYARFTAVISCPHGYRDDYEFGEFGELYYLIEGMEELADGA